MLTPALHAYPIARAADAAARRVPGSDALAVNVIYTARRMK